MRWVWVGAAVVAAGLIGWTGPKALGPVLDRIRFEPRLAEVQRVARWYWEDRRLLREHPMGPVLIRARVAGLTNREKVAYQRVHDRAGHVAMRRLFLAEVDRRLAEQTGGDVRLVNGAIYSGVNTDCGDPGCPVHGAASGLLPRAPREPGKDTLPD